MAVGSCRTSNERDALIAVHRTRYPESAIRKLNLLVTHVFRKVCQQIITHPSERKASWMSARLS
jgi:hypothetical protein